MFCSDGQMFFGCGYTKMYPKEENVYEKTEHVIVFARCGNVVICGMRECSGREPIGRWRERHGNRTASAGGRRNTAAGAGARGDTGSQIVLFYGNNTWSYTRLGRIEGYAVSELRTLLGAGLGSLRVTLSLS